MESLEIQRLGQALPRPLKGCKEPLISRRVSHAQFLANVFRQNGHDERAGYGLALADGCSLFNGPARGTRMIPFGREGAD
jgi:hypothetical protein